jgi:hypothetical protein
MANYSFKHDVVEGEAGEQTVVDWLCKNLDGVWMTYNKTNTHDVFIKFPERKGLWSGEVSLEIKTDVLIKTGYDTGNMFIEYHSRGKPSGISTCQADLFVTFFKNLGEVWVIPTQDLKFLVTVDKFREVTNAGDAGSGTCGYLIPRMKYREHFKRYKVV